MVCIDICYYPLFFTSALLCFCFFLLFVCLPVSACLTVSLCVFLSLSLCVYVYLSVSVYLDLPGWLAVSLSVFLFCLFVSVCTCMHVYLHVIYRDKVVYLPRASVCELEADAVGADILNRHELSLGMHTCLVGVHAVVQGS